MEASLLLPTTTCHQSAETVHGASSAPEGEVHGVVVVCTVCGAGEYDGDGAGLLGGDGPAGAVEEGGDDGLGHVEGLRGEGRSRIGE